MEDVGWRKKMYEGMVRQIVLKNLVEEARWTNCVEKLGGRIFWKNLVVILCGKIGWKPCFKCFVFFMRQIGRNSLVEKSMDKMYWKN